MREQQRRERHACLAVGHVIEQVPAARKLEGAAHRCHRRRAVSLVEGGGGLHGELRARAAESDEEESHHQPTKRRQAHGEYDTAARKQEAAQEGADARTGGIEEDANEKPTALVGPGTQRIYGTKRELLLVAQDCCVAAAHCARRVVAYTPWCAGRRQQYFLLTQDGTHVRPSIHDAALACDAKNCHGEKQRAMFRPVQRGHVNGSGSRDGSSSRVG